VPVLSSPQPELTRARRQELGAFYTPPALAASLVAWAVRADTKRVFDPSFGDGRFLSAAAARLRAVGVRTPHRRLFGMELDPVAASKPAALKNVPVPDGQLLEGNFFSTDLSGWGGRRFDAIVGNPPYVRHHLLGQKSKRLAQAHARRVGITLSERADCWAYFCAALLDYLEPEGRLAILLPGAILHADYALPLLHALSEARGRARLIRIQQRLFDDVVERTVVLLIDGRRRQAGVDYREVKDLLELQTVLGEAPGTRRGWRSSASVAPQPTGSPITRLRTRLRWFVSHEVGAAWASITALPEVRCLGELAQIRIGVVTGANRFFVVSAARARELIGRGRRVHAVPVVSRGGWLQRLRWTAEDQTLHADRASHLLLIPADVKLTPVLVEHILNGERLALHKRGHCAARDVWYCLEDARAPDLFLPYMGASPPRLVMNQAGATCTNAVHRVTLVGDQVGAAALAAASWTSLYRLSAELFGRSYGAGVLKMELGEAAQLRLAVVPGAARHALAIEAALHEEGVERAQSLADRVLLEEALGIPSAQIELLREAADQLQLRRGH
jgi:adenine-specific DNA-methyltransferase